GEHNRTKQAILIDPIEELQNFAHIGPITVWHLAKNLGLNVAKPDRHLARLSAQIGFIDADDLCSRLADQSDEPKKVVDLILWRYIADNVT
ncbi:unnamed protein product, partial [Ectocarpus sp. 12 AP-2014]